MDDSDRGAFGTLLREWRAARGVSQLDLAVAADVSSRHISFIETGRSKPSRTMVLLLADVLDIPLRQRNHLLAAAGFADAYLETELEAPEMVKLRKVLDYILNGSEPNPTFVLDRRQNVVNANRGMERFLGFLLDEIPEWHLSSPNYVRLMLHPAGLRRYVRNWDEVARALVDRMHREVGPVDADRRARAILEEVLAYPNVPKRWAVPDASAPTSIVIPMHVVKGGFEVRLFSTVTTVGGPRDVTAQELRIECFVPADDPSEDAIESLAGKVG